MKIMSLKTKVCFEVDISRSGENHQPCPECSKDRRHKSAKSFSFNAAKGVGKCFNCDASFVEYKPQPEKKQYKIPEWKNRTALTDNAALWFRNRGINDNTLNSMSVSSAVEYMPQTGKEENVVCFPYFRDGQLVNIKYRDGAKRFKMVSGAELIFYNIDSIFGARECTIVEGEIDCLSMIECGIKAVISVPNGAGGMSLEYIDNCYDQLSGIEKFHLAVDNDPSGYKLREELIRRLGAERCAIVQMRDCKDANEYLQKYGGYDLGGILKESVDVPVSGVIRHDQIYERVYNLYIHGLQPGVTIGMPTLDEYITWELGRLAVVTGIPGHGKSEIVDFIVSRLNMIHGWKAAYYSPENYPLELHFSKIASKIVGKSFNDKHISKDDFERVFEYVNDNYYYIYPEEDITIENILDKAKYTVKKYGVRVVVVDPYNKLEHARNAGESETEYISRFLDKLSMFSKVHNCLVILVAHPTKMQRMKDDRLKFEIPTLYDISGSANFYNKSDFGLVVYRNFGENTLKIIVSKVKFKHLGTPGEATFCYNGVNGRIHTPYNSPDYANYLTSDWNQPVQLAMSYDDEIVPF